MRVRYGKPIKVTSLVGKQDVLKHANNNVNHICFSKDNSFYFSSELGSNSQAKTINVINEHKYFCFVKLTFTPTGTDRFIFYKGDSTTNTDADSNACSVDNYYHYSINTCNNTSSITHLNFYLNTYQAVTGDILFGGIIDLTAIGLDNLTAQEFYNKYNKYLLLIATGEEITIDDKAGQIAYKNLEEDSIRCKIAGGSSDIYYGYNSCFQYWYMFNDRFRTGWSESGFATRVDDRDNQIITLTVADTTQTPQWFAYMWPDSFQPSGTFANHKVLFMIDVLSNKELTGVRFNYSKLLSTNIPNEWTTCWVILENNAMNYNYLTNGIRTNFEVGDTISFKNVQCIDLTKWFGDGKEPTSLAEFRERFTKEIWGYCPTPIKLTRYQIEALPNYGYNQLADGRNQSQYNCTMINDNNHYWIINGTESRFCDWYVWDHTVEANHLYLILVKYISGTYTGNGQVISYLRNAPDYHQSIEPYGNIIVGEFNRSSTSKAILMAFRTGRGALGTFTDYKLIYQGIDLTDWYGEGNEPTTIEEFKATFPNKYYPYSKKRLLNKYMINKLIN